MTGALMDCRTIAAELGVKRTFAERIMRDLPKIRHPEVRRVYVKREDVERWLKENTRAA